MARDPERKINLNFKYNGNIFSCHYIILRHGIDTSFPSSSSSPVCRPPFQVIEGTCLFVGSPLLSWDDSRQACKDMGADLAVVQSQQHARDILNLVQAETGNVKSVDAAYVT